MKSGPVFVKFGGSLITDKTRPETPRPDVIARLAGEVRQVLDARPEFSLLLGHGSGSYGHWLGRRYGTRDGVRGREGWVGYARVAAVAARLDRLVTDAFLDAGVPVLALQPSASARCRDGALLRLDVGPLCRALHQGLVPLVYGDVALDEVRGGTIISTEEILAYLARALQGTEWEPARILLLGETPGVYGPGGQAVPSITSHNFSAVAGSLGDARGVDVTGGMDSKVRLMLDLVQDLPGLVVQVLSGLQPGLLSQALLDADLATGTRITHENVG